MGVDGNIYFAVGTQRKSSKKIENSCWQIGNDVVTYYSLLKHRRSSKEKMKKSSWQAKSFLIKYLSLSKLDRKVLLSEKKLFRKKNLTEKRKSDKISLAAEKAAQTDPWKLNSRNKLTTHSQFNSDEVADKMTRVCRFRKNRRIARITG